MKVKFLLMIAAVVFLAAGFGAKAEIWKEGQTLRIGHRGARALADENTIESIMKAIETGVDYVEFDVRRTKDDVYVLMHDPTVDRTTDGKGKVSEMTIAEFKKLKTRSGYTPPTLEEVLAALKPTRAGIILDIKLKDPKCVPEIFAAVDRYGLVDRAIFETSYPRVANAVEKFNSELVSAIYPSWPRSALRYARKYKLDSIALYHPFARPRYVKKAKKDGFKVMVWTVNNAKSIERFEDKVKVDGILTDDPRLFQQQSGCGCGKKSSGMMGESPGRI